MESEQQPVESEHKAWVGLRDGVVVGAGEDIERYDMALLVYLGVGAVVTVVIAYAAYASGRLELAVFAPVSLLGAGWRWWTSPRLTQVTVVDVNLHVRGERAVRLLDVIEVMFGSGCRSSDPQAIRWAKEFRRSALRRVNSGRSRFVILKARR